MATTTRDSARARDRAIEASPTRDRQLLRAFLERDRLRAAYAICDLDEKEFGRTRWGVATENGEVIAVVLEYTGLTPQPLFVAGDPVGVAAIVRDVVRPRLVYLAADAGHLPELQRVYRIDSGPPMIRMWVDHTSFRPVSGVAVRLLPVEIGDLNRLYGLGFTSWLPADAIASGVYYGVRVGGRLVAAAGTHVVSEWAGLAAVGNVMTDADYRGRGYAKLTTGAVTQELLGTCEQVVLNVRSDNPPAIAAYRALGYREHCRFEERLAHRRRAGWDSILGQLRSLLSRRESA
ncbi:MAG TPA: GNAT family N-acetyltransferase [Candidatus Caenarcaniphilales bacterium]|nr:GNAT family N-acetyltransferase [Candidatus Caenarcaniphilales bacterium]